jgi:hypothetical protein
VRRAAALLDLVVDRAGDLVTRQELGRALVVVRVLYQRSASSSVVAYCALKTSGM